MSNILYYSSLLKTIIETHVEGQVKIKTVICKNEIQFTQKHFLT